jgi:hypothetical protein
MKCNGNSQNQTPDVQNRVEDACVETTDELLFKIMTFTRKCKTLVTLANQRLHTNLPLNCSKISSQAEKTSMHLKDNAILVIFRFLRTSQWALRLFDEQQVKQQSLGLEPLGLYDKPVYALHAK